MPASVICGLQWGDEGKGKTTDFLAEQVAMVVRYQGGDNAGHTVVRGDEAAARAELVEGLEDEGMAAQESEDEDPEQGNRHPLGDHAEIGAHLLWMDRASAPGQAWVGFRFIGFRSPACASRIFRCCHFSTERRRHSRNRRFPGCGLLRIRLG